MIKSYINEIHVYESDDSRVVAKVKADDGCCVKIETTSIHTLNSWRELSKEIETAIEKMDLNEAKAH